MLYVERALFLVAPQDSGKSTTLRSMFRDHRLGSGGVAPPSKTQPKLDESYRLSNERRLYLRLTSPHEANESVEEFLEKTRRKMDSGRWCFAGPLQPLPFRQMPDVVASVDAFLAEFKPERVRVAFLSPNRHGLRLDADEFSGEHDLTAELLRLPRVEVICLDGRERDKHGLLLSDFFDFT